MADNNEKREKILFFHKVRFLIDKSALLWYNLGMKFEQVILIKGTTLAYVGDSVFTLYVRSKLADPHISQKELVSKSARIVSAVIQALIYDRIYEQLDESERSIGRKCLNAHLNNKAKSATMLEYKKATALEGVLGALYLSDEKERLSDLLEMCYKIGEDI